MNFSAIRDETNKIRTDLQFGLSDAQQQLTSLTIQQSAALAEIRTKMNDFRIENGKRLTEMELKMNDLDKRQFGSTIRVGKLEKQIESDLKEVERNIKEIQSDGKKMESVVKRIEGELKEIEKSNNKIESRQTEMSDKIRQQENELNQLKVSLPGDDRPAGTEFYYKLNNVEKHFDLYKRTETTIFSVKGIRNRFQLIS